MAFSARVLATNPSAASSTPCYNAAVSVAHDVAPLDDPVLGFKAQTSPFRSAASLVCPFFTSSGTIYDNARTVNSRAARSRSVFVTFFLSVAVFETSSYTALFNANTIYVVARTSTSRTTRVCTIFVPLFISVVVFETSSYTTVNADSIYARRANSLTARFHTIFVIIFLSAALETDPTFITTSTTTTSTFSSLLILRSTTFTEINNLRNRVADRKITVLGIF
mmetsp:Transcript_44341/g.72166  ORF Transcript_44341/g.72166 Transcript_44341/m.72166 type:complete len:223 (-) Transcript_44341:2906-3574(-)